MSIQKQIREEVLAAGKLWEAEAQFGRVVFVDEVTFSSNLIPDKEWSHKKENFHVIDEDLTSSTVRVIMGINAQEGVVAKFFASSHFNGFFYIDFLRTI